jgi:hypothetical protein
MKLSAALGDKLGSKLGKLLCDSFGPKLGLSLGNKLGSVLRTGSKLGTELGAPLGSKLGLRLGIELGERLGSKLEMELGIALLSNEVIDADLQLLLQMFGQKNLTFFPVIGSVCLHRLIGCAESHLAQSLSCSLLKRKVSLFSHSPRTSVGEIVGDADDNAVGNTVGDLDLHLVLQIVGQKNSAIFPVIGSIFLHRLIGFAEIHLAQFLSCLLLKRKVSLSSHSPRSSVGEDVGDAEGDAVGDTLGDLDLHFVLQIVGQKNFAIFPVTGSIFLHRLIGFVEIHLAQSLSCSLLKRKVSLFSHSSRSLVGEDVGDTEGAVGNLVGVVVGKTVAGISTEDGESDGLDLRRSCDGVDGGSSVGLVEGEDVV